MSEKFGLEDRGERQQFNTGSQRDTADGKPRPDFISPFARLRIGTHFMLGAVKYADWNYTKGQPTSRYRQSLERHMMEADLGLEDEDHLSAAVFNLIGMIHNQEMKKLGLLPPELDDWPIDWNAQMHGGDPHPRYNQPGNKDPAAMKAAVEAADKYLTELRQKLKALFQTEPKVVEPTPTAQPPYGPGAGLHRCDHCGEPAIDRLCNCCLARLTLGSRMKVEDKQETASACFAKSDREIEAVLRSYARDLRKHGAALDGGLPGFLERLADRMKKPSDTTTQEKPNA